MVVFALWWSVGPYEGEDSFLGVYSSKELAYKEAEEFKARNKDADLYVTKLKVDGNAMWDNTGDPV